MKSSINVGIKTIATDKMIGTVETIKHSKLADKIFYNFNATFDQDVFF